MHLMTTPIHAAATLLLTLTGLPALAALPAAVDGTPLPTLAPMLERVTPAVVNIATRDRVRQRENPLLSDPFFRRFFDLPAPQRRRPSQSLGSGVIIDADQGYVITNHHVIAKAQTITVTLRDGRELPATLVGSDPEADVAVVQVEADGLSAVALADSDRLRVGDFVVAIGNPFGLGQTVTSGIVSALGRSGLGIEGYEDFIQTDASINPGNSGGALVNLNGELIGINTAILAPSGGNVGIGFAIPANMVSELVEQLVQHGEVRRGQLGIALQDLTPQLAEAFGLDQRRGAVVSQVIADSPAERAGLHPGDVIVAVNGKPLRGASQLRNAVGLHRIGEVIELGIVRDGRPRTLRLEVAEAAQASVSLVDGGDIDPRLAGARLRDLDASHPLHGRIRGVLVSEAERGSPAWGNGIRQGDVILSINRRPVGSVTELGSIDVSGGQLLINIQRGRRALFILVH